MFGKFKSVLFVLIFALSLQASDKKVYSNFVELGLKQAATVPMIMKNYIMMEMHNNFRNPEKEYKKGIALFIKLQEEISKLPLDKETKKVIAEHQKIWIELESILKKPAAEESFMDVNKYAFLLITSLRKITEKTKNKIHESQYNAIYYAGKLSEVSQSLASLYMLANRKKDLLRLKVDLLIEKNIFLDTLISLEHELSLDGKMDDSSKTILKMLKSYFEYYKFLETTTKTFKPTLIYSKTNAMFKYSNNIMEMLLKKAKQ